MPFSRLIWEQMQYIPDIYRDRISLVVDTAMIDITRLKDSVEIALRNHPVFSTIVSTQGEQSYHPSDNI